MEAVYELEYLLLEGHCYEADSGQPPRGLQFILGRTDKPDSAVFDTIVMANLVSTDSSFTDYDVTQRYYSHRHYSETRGLSCSLALVNRFLSSQIYPCLSAGCFIRLSVPICWMFYPFIRAYLLDVLAP